MHESNQQKVLAAPKVIRNIGIVLFALSFLVPDGPAYNGRLHFFSGSMIFIEVPSMPFFRPSWDYSDVYPTPLSFNQILYNLMIFVLFWGSWAANFTIFFRLPLIVRLISILLPWVAYAWLFSLIVGFIPFYFWIAGIMLIHLSRPLKPVPVIIAGG